MAGSNSPCQPREGQLRHQQTNNLIDNAPVRIIGNGGEKRKQKENSPSLPSPGNRKWGMVVAGSYFLCGVRIRSGGDSSDQNPIVVKLWWWH